MLKQKLRNAKNRVATYVQTHPYETAIIALAVVSTGAKVLETVTEAKKADTWQREVTRRERHDNA